MIDHQYKIFKGVMEGGCADILRTIGDIPFTPRHVDILSCLISGKSTKVIANILSITPRTVETHIENIKTRVGCNTRQNLLCVVENSKKAPLLRYHYVLLNTHTSFKTSLKKIASAHELDRKILSIAVSEETEEAAQPNLSHYIISHLKHAGLEVTELSLSSKVHRRKLMGNNKALLFHIPDCKNIENRSALIKSIEDFIQDKHIDSSRVLITIQTDSKDVDICDYETVAFHASPTYFPSFFSLLEKFYDASSIAKEADNFKELTITSPQIFDLPMHSQNDEVLAQRARIERQVPTPSLQKKSFSKRKLIAFSFLFVFVCSIMVGYYIYNETSTTTRIQALESNQVTASHLIRHDLISDIDVKFKSSQSDIKYVTLVGIGGSGKTTLARQYALSTPNSLLWEANAESRQRISESMLRLATEISYKSGQKDEFDQIILMKDKEKRNKYLQQFIHNYLRAHPGWTLVFDNVNNLSEIADYLPLNSFVWGKGKVLVTTRNRHLHTNPLLSSSAFIQITPLTSSESYDLFIKNFYLDTKEQPSDKMISEIQSLLSVLPPFPLDISTAATYLRATNTSFQAYLTKLKKLNKEFNEFQSTIRKESSDYESTRFAIIANTISCVIEENEKFRDLLLFISLLDSQVIPLSLLDKIESGITVDKFVYALDKHSLILPGASSSRELHSISLHRSIHAIILEYFKQQSPLQDKQDLINQFLLAMENTVDPILKADQIDLVTLLAPHYKSILAHKNVLNTPNLVALEGTLACMLFYIEKENHKISRSLLEKYDAHRKDLSSNFQTTALRNMIYLGLTYIYGTKNEIKSLADRILAEHQRDLFTVSSQSAWALCYLGRMYYIIGEYETAKNLLEKSYSLYSQHFPENLKGYARSVAFLGNVYWRLGDYKRSEVFLKKALNIYDSQMSEQHYDSGWCLQAIGHLYSQLGEFKKSLTYFERSIEVYQKFFPENQMRLNWPRTGYGNALVDMGLYSEAINQLQQSLNNYEQYLDPMHREIGWVCLYLGRAFYEKGDKKKGRKYLEQAESIFIENLGKSHPRMAYVYHIIADVDIREGNFLAAEEKLTHIADILHRHGHTLEYRSLELLADLSLQKAALFERKEKMIQYRKHKKKALNYLNRASALSSETLPDESPIRKRILSALAKLKNDTK